MLAALTAESLILPLVTALIAAVSVMAVGWRRLTVLGEAEKGKLEAEKASIIQAAEDRATARALEALKLALDVTERERDRAIRELAEARRELTEMRTRITTLEEIVERRIRSVEVKADRRSGEDRGRIDTLRDEVDEINHKGRVGDPGPKGPPGDKGPPGT